MKIIILAFAFQSFIVSTSRIPLLYIKLCISNLFQLDIILLQKYYKSSYIKTYWKKIHILDYIENGLMHYNYIANL